MELMMLDVIIDKETNKIYLVINDKELMDDLGNFVDMKELSKNIINLGCIHTNTKLARLFYLAKDNY